MASVAAARRPIAGRGRVVVFALVADGRIAHTDIVANPAKLAGALELGE